MRTRSTRSFQGIFIVIVVFGLIILALGGYLTPLSRVLLNPIINIQTWISTRYLAIQSLVTEPEDVASLQKRNAELEAEISRLQVQVIELQQQVAEVQVLSTLVDYARQRSESRYVAAAVIGRDPSPFLHYIIINRGSDNGLRKGMPVVTQQGLVGQIAAVTAGAARVQLINDPGMSINVLLQQGDSEAVLSGEITGELNLELIPQDASVQIGELVVTSGLGGNFPPNLVIGQISTVRQRDYDLFQSASVQPAVDFSRLEIILIITNFQPIDITPLLPVIP